jgi:hypothetical protein
VLVAVQKGHTEIATDSASSLFQIRKQLLSPMAVLHHLHRELLNDIVNLIQSSPSPVTFYKVKSHSGIIGNEGADHLAHKAAVNQISDISLPPATDPFYDLFWLSVPNKVGSHAEELRILTNLQDIFKHHMHTHHYLGEANTDTLLYKLWQTLHDTPERAAQPNSHTQQPNAKPLAQLSNTFWSMPNVTFKEQEQVLKYRTDTIHTDKHTKRFSHTTGPATCPLSGGSDSALYILLRCNNHTLKRMHVNRHHHAVSLGGEEISKGKLGSAIVTMDACNSEKLSDLNIDDIERNIPDWVFPTQQNLPIRHQSRPDGVLIMPIEGRGRHLDPKQIPPEDRDKHHVEFKICSDINPQQTLEKVHNQHQPLIQRLQTRSLRGISRNNKVTLHVILLGVGGTIYNQYTITLGIPTHKVHYLATKLHCHAIKSLNKITKTRHKIHFNNNNSDNGGSGRGVTGRAAGLNRARRRLDRMADNPPDPQ